MSELCDSLHLQGATEDAAVQLLVSAKATGLVLPRRGKFTAVIVPDVHQRAVLGASRGLVIHYQFADEHGLAVRLYKDGREATKLGCDFESGRPPKFDAEPWVGHGVLTKSGANALGQALARPWPDRDQRHWVATALGLGDVEWLRGDDLFSHRQRLLERFPRARYVEEGAVGTWVPDPGAQEVVLCALSQKRLQMLEDEPGLVDDLLDARHDQKIPGLLDLGSTGGELAALVSAGETAFADALAGQKGRALAGTAARVLGAGDVRKLSKALASVDNAWVEARCKVIGRAPAPLVEAFTAVKQLYADAAARGDAMLIAVD